jgi:hypothetical protein
MFIKLQHACESNIHSFELAPVQGPPIQVQSQTGRIYDTTIGFCCKPTMTGFVTHVLTKLPWQQLVYFGPSKKSTMLWHYRYSPKYAEIQAKMSVPACD